MSPILTHLHPVCLNRNKRAGVIYSYFNSIMLCSQLYLLLVLLTCVIITSTESWLNYLVLTSPDSPCPGYYNECHIFSHYIRYGFQYFGNNSIRFVFEEGEHIMNAGAVLPFISFINIDNITMTNTRIQGYNPMKSTAVIRCINDTGGFSFHNCKSVTIINLAFVDCGSSYGTLEFSQTAFVRLSYVTIENGRGLGTSISEVEQLLIEFSSFSQKRSVNISSQCFHTTEEHGNVRLVNMKTEFSTVVIKSSNFTNGCIKDIGRDSLGSGGGILVYILYGISSNITTKNCRFLDNYSPGSYGGGLSLQFLDCYSCYALIDSCTFIGNTADIGGAGVYIAVYKHYEYNENNVVIHVMNSQFIKNKSPRFGGGLSFFLIEGGAISITIDNSIFEGNIGSSIYVGKAFHSLDVYDVSLPKRSKFLIVNTTINGGRNAETYQHKSPEIPAISFNFPTCITVVYARNLKVVNNDMPGISLINANIIFSGRNNIIANNTSLYNGGGLSISKGYYFDVTKSSQLIFIGNRAKENGGAIYVPGNPNSNLNLYNDQMCTFHCGDSTGSVIFIDNKAGHEGNVMYGGVIFDCWPPPTESHYLNCSHLRWQYDTNDNSSITSPPTMVCACEQGRPKCDSNIVHNQSIYPGQWINVSLITVGECGGISSGSISPIIKGATIFTNGNYRTMHQCKEFNFLLKPLNYSDTANISAELNITVPAEKHFGNYFVKVKITFKPCPIGFKYNTSTRSCDCSPEIQSTISEVICNISTMLITRGGNNWISYSEENDCIIAYSHCPYDYCITTSIPFNIINSTNSQCMYNRTGILCGQCQPGLSVMLGSNKCALCSNIYLTLLLPVMLLGLGLVFFLMILNLTVSVGTINALLFYANIVKLNETAFFPRGKIAVVSQFIAWLNLDMGIETCFFNGLTDYWKTWLQFVFPIYLWLLVIAIIIGCHYSIRLSRICPSNSVPVLVTVIFMSYTKLLRSITSALMMNQLQCGQYSQLVWSVDGNIMYWKPSHLVLFIFACFTLIIGLVYTLFVFLCPLFERYDHKLSCCPKLTWKLKPLIDAYCGPYKDNYRYWTGLLLIVRVVITVIFSYTSGMAPYLNNYIICLVCVLLLTILILVRGQVYRVSYLNHIEIAFLFNLFVISSTSSLLVMTDYIEATDVVTVISISISFLFFIGIICIHLALLFKKFKRSQHNTHDERFTNIIADNETNPLIDGERNNYSPAITIHRRESLIFGFCN